MPSIKLKIEYNGAGFHGWQIQAGGLKTVQGELLRVLRMVLREDIPAVVAAGRTDSGVHALGQVVRFSVLSDSHDLGRLAAAVNGILCGEVAVLEASYVDDSFHPRKGVLCKEYHYLIETRRASPVLDRGRVWHVYSPINFELVEKEAQVLVGTHDFTSFRASGCQAHSPVKTIFSLCILSEGTKKRIVVRGSGFLKQMIRIITGTLVDFGRGRLDISSLEEVLLSKDRTMAGITAPACGLTMVAVEYE